MVEQSGRTMRLRGVPWRLIWPGRLPRPAILSVVELALLILIAVQAARLIWTVLTPLGPIGDYRARSDAIAFPSASLLGDFDPFFRLAGPPGPAVITSLNLKLHGVRENRATGRGSAIIALPDGSQRSFAVGEEILPGVRLALVGFDSVTIDRSGSREQIFLDQSGAPAPAVAAVPAAAAPTPTATTSAGQATGEDAPSAAADLPLLFRPRMNGERVVGIEVSPGADGGQTFRAAGFAPGDVIVSVNRQPVTSLAQARSALGAGSTAEIVVDRAGRRVALRIGGQR